MIKMLEVIENNNGKNYYVICESGRYAVLEKTNSLQWVVTYWITKDRNEWCEGSYFSTLTDALNYYRSKVNV